MSNKSLSQLNKKEEKVFSFGKNSVIIHKLNSNFMRTGGVFASFICVFVPPGSFIYEVLHIPAEAGGFVPFKK